MITPPEKYVIFIPLTSASGATSEISGNIFNFVYDNKVALKIVPIIGIPAVWARLLVKDRRPEATPSLSRGAVPMIALLLGVEKVPNPMPSGTSLMRYPTTPVSGFSVLIAKQPVAMISIPIILRPFVPKRSERLPDIMVKIPTHTGVTIIMKPISLGV